MGGSLLDLNDPAVRRMVKLVKQRGYVTYDELDDVLPPGEFSPDQIEEVLAQLSEMGINVVDPGEEVENQYSSLARELRSFASGQRGQGRDLLEEAAATLDAEADQCWSPYVFGAWTPPEDQRFLVFDQEQGIQIAEHDSTGAWIAQGGRPLTQVTHWRELPQPPSSSTPSHSL